MDKKYNIALLVLRIAAGIIFIAHGWMKVSNVDATRAGFAGMGLPEFIGPIVGYVELIAGVMVLLGLWTAYAAAALGVIMLTALFWVKGGAVFRTFNVPVFEIDLALLAITTALALEGSGKYAVRPSHGIRCGCQNGTCEVR